MTEKIQMTGRGPRTGRIWGDCARTILKLEIRLPQTCFFGVLLFAITTANATAEQGPTPTPTTRPKLSGGFGRAPATPAPATANGGTGQSLSDAVRASAEAKKRNEQKPGISITNQTLITDPSKGRLTIFAPRSPTPTGRPTGSSVTSPAPTAPPGAAAAEGEAEWRERARAARKRVEDLKERVAQLERDAKRLENDFYSWDDGQYRDGVIKPAWDKKREELETTKRDLAEAEKDLAELPDRARKAGALPGWIRE